MIKSLSINNYALIQSLEMEPSPNLNIITGETGAGKSIMLGAVGLLLGNRADVRTLFSEDSKCVIEGAFDLSQYQLKNLFTELELDYESECIIRREISPTGKSRAFVNDSPVTLDVLKTLGVKLMDIHSQHESLELGSNKYQEEILDIYASHHQLIEAYQSAYSDWKSATRQLTKLEEKAKESAQDSDYKQYLYNELEQAKLQADELKSLEEELNVLENAEEIKTNLGQLSQALDESEFSAFNQLKDALPLLLTIRKYNKKFEELYDRLNSASIEVQDIAAEISKEQEIIEHDPQRLAFVKERVDLLNRLLIKHQTKEVSVLISLRDQLQAELENVLNLDEAIQKAKKLLEEKSSQLQKAGKKLSESRQKNTQPLAKAIESLIHKLGIENATVVIQVSPSEPTSTGMDLVDFLFSANKGVQPREVKHVASGGEFSRLIFAVKYLLADKTALPTIIFDEIDTGVSGEVALQMVNMMKQMAKNHQVISISHLPQFAAGGDAHYFVYKDHSSDRSVSRMKKLSGEERVMAIAKMIGGDKPGENAIASAKELLSI